MNKKYLETLGLCYAITENNASPIFIKVIDFLESDAPDYFKLKVYHALFQTMIEHRVHAYARIGLFVPDCQHLLVELFNQRKFIDLFIEKVFHLDFFAEIFLPFSEQIFSSETIRYVLNRPDLPNWLFAFFASHPVILENIEWQKKYIKYFYMVYQYVNAVYVTDQAIEESDPDDVRKFFYRLSLRNEPVKLSFSLECLKRTLYTYLIAQNDQDTRRYIDWLKQGQFTCDFVPKIPEINVNPYRYYNLTMRDFCNMDTVIAAIERLRLENLDRIMKLLELFMATHYNKKESTSVYVRFRAALIDLMKFDPVDVAKILHSNCKNRVVYRLFHDRTFMKVVSSLRKKRKVHIDFDRYTDEIASQCNYARQSLFANL